MKKKKFMDLKNVQFIDANIFVNKKTGQMSITLPKKKLKANNPKYLMIKIKDKKSGGKK
jgi:hypothetical protein|tara:strand:+ start:225 stop:401 length:177 start_codon:yes stop_codon:yes gene_type:complete